MKPAHSFASTEEIADLMAHFEIGDAKPWTHAAHLTMAFWYLSRMDEAQATERIRSGILHYNECQGTPNTDTRGYHQTLTIFWIRIVSKFLKDADASWTDLETVNRLLDTYAGQSGLWREYYSFDLIPSGESRRRWIEPDRQGLNTGGPSGTADPSPRGSDAA